MLLCVRLASQTAISLDELDFSGNLVGTISPKRRSENTFTFSLRKHMSNCPDACIFGVEALVDDGWILIPLCEPSFHFLAELLDDRDASIQTLTVEDVQADFGDVEPTAALGCEMHVNLVCNPFGFLWREDFVQRSFLMRIQVIHDQGNGIRFRIVVIHKVFHNHSPVSPGAPLRTNRPLSEKLLKKLLGHGPSIDQTIL